MDTDDSWILSVLKDILPEPTLRLLDEHVLRAGAPPRRLANAARALATSLRPVVQPTVQRLLASLASAPDAALLLAAVVGLVAALQVLLLVRRAVALATRLALRLLWWSLVAALVAAAWRRGPEAVAADCLALAGRVAGYAAVVRDIWWSEYQKYDAQTRAGGGVGAGGVGGGGGAQHRMSGAAYRGARRGGR
ncbi:hypothetical protein GGR56DRAFT_672828 [Xylariaceae sp. FL0804]|nr:hypothetical protein GGR56DRAFT_672828 [Xylariaceae sp. FL0804]